MTEEEWLACTDPGVMLQFLEGKGSERKMRLFACACCRGVWEWLEDESRTGVEVAEKYADGATTFEEMSTAEENSADVLADAASDTESAALGYTKWHAANSVVCCTRIPLTWDLASYASQLARQAESCHLLETVNEGVDISASLAEPKPSDGASHAALLRCIFGNPFRPVAIESRQVTDAAVTLARTIYHKRKLANGHLDARRLAVLADSLEDAGCTNVDVLSHCRQPGEHARGCWVLDLILGLDGGLGPG